jgi:hypothetical protein
MLRAQDAQPSTQQQTAAEQASAQGEQDQRRIVVIGNRAIIATLQDVEPEDTYDEDRVQSYDVSTVGELLDQVRSENGDDQATLLVNGQPVRDTDDIADLPIEAVRRVEQLPRGTAQRIGGGLAQRAYNIVLKPSVKSATVTLSHQQATEGDWGQGKGEALFTYVRNQDRVNVTLRGSQSDLLFESDRDLVPAAPAFPYAILGNVIPFTGTQVDPVLSARVGQPVTIVGLNGNAHPTQADLIAGANLANPNPAPDYRSLRSASRPYEIAVAGNKTLTTDLSLSFNSRLYWSESRSLQGLPSARFLVPATNAYTPFSTPVFLALSDIARPLRSNSSSDGKSLSATLNANFGQWHGTLNGRYDERNSRYDSDLQGFFPGGYYTVDNAVNPFAGSLVGLIPVSTRTSTSHNIDRQVQADMNGPLAQLPAGLLIARIGVSGLWTSYDATDISGSRSLDRHELTGKVGLTIPLTGPMFLSSLGTSELALDYGRADLGKFGTIDRYTVGLNWSPVKWLRITASEVKDTSPIYSDYLAAPTVVTDNVPYFDPVRNETVDVRLVTGGTSGLLNPETRTRALSLTATPLPKYNLQLNLDYQEVEQRNLIGSVPPPSSAVVLAFPNRFVRDATGRLVQVDTTAVNFDRQNTNQLRAGVSFTVPIAAAVAIPRTATTPSRRIPATTLQVNLSHTHILDSTTVIRAGLPEVDLLNGGAIGIGGGRQRDFTTGTIALSRGATGIRLNANYRGPSYLLTGTTAAPDQLTFGPVFDVDLRLFADLGQLMPRDPMAKGTRLSLVFDNLFNDRQKVTNSAGLTPQVYQPAYRDSVGRTVMFELRKVF